MQQPKNFWENIHKNVDYENVDLKTFRGYQTKLNRFSDWGPYDKTQRYYKSLMFEMALYLDQQFEASDLENFPNSLSSFFSKLSGDNYGDPCCITFKNRKISFDFLHAAEECLRCAEYVKASEYVVEIGAGYGRTAHAFLQTFPTIKTYTILDLPETLSVSKAYLSKVLEPDLFAKLSFITNVEASSLSSAELFINIDSFQEMPPETAQAYLDLISQRSQYFFCKNAVCKFAPELIGARTIDPVSLDLALRSGLCRDLGDIFDNQDLSKHRKNYQQKYCPEGFKVIGSTRCFAPYNHFEATVFERV